MSLITRMRKQTAVWWPMQGTESGGSDFDNDGNPQYSDPVEIDCRWEDVNEEFLDITGTTQMSNAIVYVDRVVRPGGILMLGDLTDITAPVNIRENDGAWEIKRVDALPNLKATEFLRTVYL